VFPPPAASPAGRLCDGASSCSPETYASTDPVVDANGKFTGEVKITINDALIKSPCVRDCIVEHEEVHRRDLTPILREIADCDNAAGDDERKKGECNALSNSMLPQIKAQTECNAYRASYTCLTLKETNSKSPCSRSPHKEVVRKHRGYESCELAKHCRDAGRPAEGIPNS
jgi:hypothetical protein